MNETRSLHVESLASTSRSIVDSLMFAETRVARPYDDTLSIVFVTILALFRDVTITPSNSWGGQGMLGVTIRFDTYHNAEENLVSRGAGGLDG